MQTQVPEHVTAAVNLFCRRADIHHDEYVYMFIWLVTVLIDSKAGPCCAVFIQGPIDPTAHKPVYQQRCYVFDDS